MSGNLNVQTMDVIRPRLKTDASELKAAPAPALRSNRVTPSLRSEISLLSVTINYRIPKKYFMLVNRVSIKRIEKLFQSLPRCVEKSLCCEKYI